jgi:hypothetical protein
MFPVMVMSGLLIGCVSSDELHTLQARLELVLST